MTIARTLNGATKLAFIGLKTWNDVLFLKAAYEDKLDDDALQKLFLINKGLDLVNMFSNICTHTGDDHLEIGEGLRVLKGIAEGVTYGVLGSAAAKGCAIASAVYDGTFGLANSLRFFQSKSIEIQTVTPPAGYAPLAGVAVVPTESKKLGQ